MHLVLLEVTLAPATLQMCLLPSACGILALQDYVWWELTPETTYTDPRPSSVQRKSDLRWAEIAQIVSEG